MVTKTTFWVTILAPFTDQYLGFKACCCVFVFTKKINREIVDQFIKRLSIIDWDKKAAEHYGSIRELLQIKGNVIGAKDMKIAAMPEANASCYK